MRFIGRRSDPVPPELVERMEWAEELTARQRPDHAVRRVQLRRPGGDRRCRANLQRRRRGGVPRPPVRARDARPRPDHPHQRRARISNFLLWQGALLRARVPRRAVAGLLARGVRAEPRPSSRRGSAGSGAADARPPRTATAGGARRPAGGARTSGHGSWSRSRPRSSRSCSSTSAGSAWALFLIALGWSACTSSTDARALEAGAAGRVRGGRRAGARGPLRERARQRARGGGGGPPRAVPGRARARPARTPHAWRSRARCSASGGSASRSPTPSCCASFRTAAAILIDVLVGHVPRRHRRRTWAGGCSGGACSRPRSPRARPSKGCSAACSSRSWRCCCAGLLQNTWMTQGHALLLGVAVAVLGAARGPVRVAGQARRRGQGHRSAVRRHGGALDRVDAALFTILVGYYIWFAVIH